MKNTQLIVILILIIVGLAIAWKFIENGKAEPVVSNFEECVIAGNPIMESYPRQCRHEGENYIENISNISLPKACTKEARVCEDGTSVGRTGPNCEFTPCPSTKRSCKKDSDCPSSQYMCQETKGSGTVCSSADPSCVPTHTIIAGECKLKEGYRCNVDSDCASGNLCHKNICTSPIGERCSGPSDTSCPTDFECVESCGPPVVRYPDESPPSYSCQLKDYVHSCPICLAKNTLIDTPSGLVVVQNLQKGSSVWTVNNSGKRVPGVVLETSKTPVPPNHKMVELVLDDGRKLRVSPGHPTIDERTVEDLSVGDMYDGALIISANQLPYGDEYTFDILTSGETGFYFANDILLDSTLRSSDD